MNKILARLRQTAGETIGETLAAMLIVAMSFVFLAGAVVTAARVNATLTVEETSFQPASSNGVPSDVTVNGEQVPVTMYETENGYVYYVYDAD